MMNLIVLRSAAVILGLISFMFYKWLTKYKDDDKKNGNTEKNTANKNIVEEPAIPAKEIPIHCRRRIDVSKSKYESTRKTTNQSRLERIIAGPCTDVLRDFLLKEISPSDLLKKVKSQIKIHKTKKPGFPTQLYDIKKKLEDKDSYEHLDITSLYYALRNVCNIQPHSNGWGENPNSNDRSVSANIDRIRSSKNTYKSHNPGIDISDSDFQMACDELFESVADLEMYLGNETRYQNAVKRLQTISMDPEQKVDLIKVAENIKDTRIAWIERIISEDLAKFFSSFNKDFPMDHCSRLVILKLLEGDVLQELETDIKSLTNGVVLTKQIVRTTGAKPMHAYVFEVNVDIDEDKFCFVEKGIKTDSFFEINDNDIARVILIRSQDIHIVKTKLAVYNKYKDDITKLNILLHHEYEEFDEVAKCVAFKRLSSFCDFIMSKIDGILKRKCKSGFEEIHQIISKYDGPIRYQKIEEVLTKILRRFQEIRDNIRPTDQMKLIDEWSKGEVIQNSSELTKNKSIVEYIVGHRGDGDTVVKVFLRRDDEMARELVKNCCKVSRDIKFEFVNIEAEKKKIVQDKKKNNPLAPGVSNRKELKQIVQKYTDEIFATYSNVVAVDQDVCEEGFQCIVLYCLDETLMPYGEKPLPKSIEGFRCKIKEAIPMLGMCKNCQYPCQNVVMPGCSIGTPSSSVSGSVGFLVESKNPKSGLESGFLTTSHVAIADFHKLYIHQSLLSMMPHPLGPKTHSIVHPSWEDNNHIDNIVGEVVESFIGNFGHNNTGLDIAVVKNNSGSREGKKEILQLVSEDVLDFNGEIKVMKYGRETGKTFGYLKHDSLALKVALTESKRYLRFNNCYAVEDIDHRFFEDGDSGAAVYVVKEDESLQPLGIAFARFDQTTAVCKINDILNRLDLNIVRYIENTEESVEKA